MTRLLVLEDDPQMQTLLVMLFEDAAYDVMTAMQDDALSAALAHPKIVVVGCDGTGTFEPGWQVAELLRRQLPAATMIMLSTNARAVHEVGHTVRGRLFDGGVRKPFFISDLLACVAACHATQSQRLGSSVAASPRRGDPPQIDEERDALAVGNPAWYT
jgi:DNA-binding response OmpR family regulator